MAGAAIRMDVVQILSLLGISGIIGGVLGAFYGPLVSDYLKRRRLRQNLYRELVDLYERAIWWISLNDEAEKAAYITPSTFDRSGRATSTMGGSIYQSQLNPQIFRSALKWKLQNLNLAAAKMEARLIDNNLYHKMLANDEDLRLFYQLNDSLSLETVFDNFLLAPTWKLPPFQYVPTTSLLTKEEANRLCLLEAQFDWLKIACRAYEEAEDQKGLDTNLLQWMRGWRPRGTLMCTFGQMSKNATWCGRCEEFVPPKGPNPLVSLARYYADWFTSRGRFGNALAKERCNNCGAAFPSVEHALESLYTKFRGSADADLRSKALLTVSQFYWLTANVNAANFLLEALSSDDVKLKALEDIGNLGTKASFAAEAISDLLKSGEESWEIRGKAAWALGEIWKGHRNLSLDALLAVVNYEDDEWLGEISSARARAVEALGKIGNSKVLASLTQIVTDEASSPDVREKAVYALGRMGEPAVNVLLKILNDKGEYSFLRWGAAYILGEIGDQTVVPYLKTAARDKDTQVRNNANASLTLINPEGMGYTYATDYIDEL
jgi:HEAT repeat protein